MNTIEINGYELHLTDNATNESNVYKCGYYVANHSPSWTIVAENEVEALEYMIMELDVCEDPDEAETDEERELIESYYSIEESASFIEAYNDVNADTTAIVDYILNHSGDTVSVEVYVELVELVELASSDESIEHSDLCREFRLIDEDDIEEIYQDYIEEMVKDCYLGCSELPSFLEIDWKATAENCLADGYGHSFSSYDGSEELINSTYIFCVN